MISDKKGEKSVIPHCIEQKLASKLLALSGNNMPASCHVEKVKHVHEQRKPSLIEEKNLKLKREETAITSCSD